MQGVQAIIAESFERIHRCNLVGMGILPLVFQEGQNINSLGLHGDESYDIQDLDDTFRPRNTLRVWPTRPDASRVEFEVTVQLNTKVEINYYRNGGILQTVLRNLMR